MSEQDELTGIELNLKEIGASETVKTIQALLIAHQLGELMRESYSMRKSESVKMVDRFAHLMATRDPALGAIVDGFINGWIGDKKA
jgi:hypothetical protein